MSLKKVKASKKNIKKVKGSVLAFTTLILVVITALISVIFLQSGMVLYFQSLVIKRNQMYADIDIGIDYLLIKAEDETLQPLDISQLLNDARNPVSLINRRWGAFEVVGARKTDSDLNQTKMGYVGYSIPESKKVSLYLSDEGTPLNLCGQTHLEGNVYAPSQGVKRGYLAGMPYLGDQLVYGKVYQSSAGMPDVFREQQSLIQVAIEELELPNSSRYITMDDLINQPINSFSNATNKLYDQSAIILSDIDCAGNFFIESETAIYIEKTANLSDIIVKAPYVFIGEGFKGSIQCYASDSLFVDRNCTLEYPSVVALITNENSGYKFLLLSDSSRVEGLVFVSSSGQLKKSTLCSISKGASVLGQVFCNGLLEANGSISGSMICRRTILFTPSSSHENYLFNSLVTPATPKHFLNILPGVNYRGQKKILKWIS